MEILTFDGVPFWFQESERKECLHILPLPAGVKIVFETTAS